MNTIASPTLPGLRPRSLAARSVALRSVALLAVCLAPIDVAAQAPDTVTFPERDAIELGAETERAFGRSGQAHLNRPLPSGALLSAHNNPGTSLGELRPQWERREHQRDLQHALDTLSAACLGGGTATPDLLMQDAPGRDRF